MAASSEHRAIFEKLRQAVRDRAAATRDIGFLPEGEIHSRSQGSTPYDMARDETKYPFERIFAAAELASDLDSHSPFSQLTALLKDPDSAVRYWGALGILMRGREAVSAGAADLRAALKDKSPHVRIVAAQALAQYGPQDALSPALATLGELAAPRTNGVFVAMSTLSAIEALGPKAAPLHEMVRKLDPQGPSPDGRFNSYVPRLIGNITGEPSPAAPAGKGKARANRNKQKQSPNN
jgi:uncharacterized sulfatase